MTLYFQPSPSRTADSALPSAPAAGLDVPALIDDLTRRVTQAERQMSIKVDNKSLARIILTDKDIVLAADQVSILGQLNIADWVRDVSGNITGGVDVSNITRITGGKIQTGIIQSTTWSSTAGSQINLDTGTIVTGGSASPRFSVSSLGVLTAQDAVIRGTLTAGSVITNTVTISGGSTTMQDLVDGMGGTFDLQGALNAGVTNILAGTGADYRLTVDTAAALVTMHHKQAVYKGTAPAGIGNLPALGISAAGLGMGFNRNSDGAWVDSVAITAAGNAIFAGTIAANSIIVNSATIDGVTIGAVRTQAGNGDTAATNTILFRTLGAPSNLPVIGAITHTSAANGTIDVTLNWTYTQGARPADRFTLYYNESTVNPTTSSALLVEADGAARSVRIPGVAMDKTYRVGIVASRTSAAGVESTAIVNSWARGGVASVLTSAIDYGFVTGTKPPLDATRNFFTTSTSNPSGGADGDAHWNSTSSTMWFRTAGIWLVGGTVNASQITVGTLAAARIAANSITSDKINVTTLSAITANLGTVNAGDITGSANITITGLATFGGNSTVGSFTAAVHCNQSLVSRHGVIGYAHNTLTSARGVVGIGAGGNFSSGVYGESGAGGGAAGIRGLATGSSSSTGVYADGGANGAAFRAIGASDFSGTIIQSSGTSALRDLNVYTGGLTVTGNATLNNALTVSGTTTINAMTKNGNTMVTNLNAQWWNGQRISAFGTGTATATFNGANKPGGNSTNSWMTIIDINGVVGRIPIWA